MHECPHGILLIAGRGDNLLYQLVVGESAGAAQCILDQVLGEAAGKVILPRGDQISQLEKVLERRPRIGRSTALSQAEHLPGTAETLASAPF